MAEGFHDYYLQQSETQIISRLKLYLPKQKSTMNETFIPFKIQGVSKYYQDWSCIYQNRNEQWMKHSFLSKYKVCPNSIKTEAVSTKTEMNNEWNIHFLQNTRCVQIVSRLKLYLPKQKCTMNETFIFYKIQGVSK